VHFILSEINVEYVLTTPQPEATDDGSVITTDARDTSSTP